MEGIVETEFVCRRNSSPTGSVATWDKNVAVAEAKAEALRIAGDLGGLVAEDTANTFDESGKKKITVFLVLVPLIEGLGFLPIVRVTAR